MDEIKNFTDANNIENQNPDNMPTTENTALQEAELECQINELSPGNETNTASVSESDNTEEVVTDVAVDEKPEPWFNKEKAYKEKVAPLMKKIIKVCAMENIPFFFASCVKDDGECSKYIKELVSPTTHQLNLSQDLFPDLVAVTLGFNTIPPIKKTEFVFDVLEEEVSE